MSCSCNSVDMKELDFRSDGSVFHSVCGDFVVERRASLDDQSSQSVGWRCPSVKSGNIGSTRGRQTEPPA